MSDQINFAPSPCVNEVTAAYQALYKELPPGTVSVNVPLREQVSFRIGGNADLFVELTDIEDVQKALRICRDTRCPYFLMGNGTNLLVKDGGVRGAVLRINKGLSAVTIEGDVVRAQAGILLATLAKHTLAEGLAGMEFAVGIPGTLGGGVRMNAGAYGGELKDVLRRVRTIDEAGNLVWQQIRPGDLGYRTSIFAGKQVVLLEVELQLSREGIHQAREQAAKNNLARTTKQPLDLPSAGSSFKRPVGGYASRLMDEAGLKGVRVGGAQVSTLHAGFIVNAGGATAKDVLALVALVQQRVLEHSGIKLELEFLVIGEDA